MRHDLQESIPYLLARAGIRTGQAFSLELKQHKLTLNEWRVCATLRHQPSQRIGEVAQHTSIDASTLSRLIDAMIKRKLVVRERDSVDARARSLHLTPKGEEVVDRVIPLAQLYERVALAGMSRDEAQALRGFLARIYDNMDMLNHRD
jgi:DNA-binding MarR family transcriptional regulator